MVKNKHTSHYAKRIKSGMSDMETNAKSDVMSVTCSNLHLLNPSHPHPSPLARVCVRVFGKEGEGRGGGEGVEEGERRWSF